jgi:hypothetical protein
VYYKNSALSIGVAVKGGRSGSLLVVHRHQVRYSTCTYYGVPTVSDFLNLSALPDLGERELVVWLWVGEDGFAWRVERL